MSLVYSGLSAGIAFGVVSGALFLIGNTFYASKSRRRVRPERRQHGSPKRKPAETCPCTGGEEAGALERRSSRAHASLRCSLCGGVVCRACSRVVRPSARIRLCDTCYQHRELTHPGGEWFYQQLQTKFHDVIPSSSSESLNEAKIAASIDASLEVREFVERLTENIVGGSIDDVTVEPLSSQIEYEQLCSEFHPQVKDVLTRLSQALQIAITDLSTVKLAIGESPSEIHVQLKKLVSDMRAKALELPLLEMDTFLEQEGASPLKKKSPIDFNKRSYEELLSTAIINKVVENSQCALMEEHLKTPSCNNCGKNKNFVTCIKIGVNNEAKITSERQAATQPKNTADSEEDDSDAWSSTDEDSAASESTEASPKKRCTHKHSSDFAQFLEGLKHSNRVPFPELGADIVEGTVQETLLDETARTTLYLVNSDSRKSSLSSASWEENWLFQKKRLNFRSTNRNGGMGRVPMLVPNPKFEHRHIRAKIGDTDADQLSSDLSDYESYMSRDEESTSLDNEPASLESTGRQEADSKLPPDLIEATNQEMQGAVVGATLILAPPSVNGAESNEFDQQEGEYLEDFASVGHRSFNNSLHGDSNDSSTFGLFSMPGSPTSESISKAKSVPDILESTKSAISSTKGAKEELDDRLCKPPMPGTIAEREHLKWQHARPIANNPYSEENIAKRLHDRKKVSSAFNMPITTNHSNIPVEPPPPISTSEPEENLRIVCTGQNVKDIKKYTRDYYINLQENIHSAPAEMEPSTDENLSSTAATNSEPVSLNGSTDDLLSGIESMPMPSVKELKKHFDVAAPQITQRKLRGSAKGFDKEVIIIENPAPPAPVHSLTGRNLSNGVRASLQAGDVVDAPKPAERHRANLEFWRQQQTPVPAPRRK
ncbi:uncharacterized protein LOC135942555 isoform X3 [Cloeon dipterum]|uniref:uncharacterized protein LOC135942555 isoform X3 n=1 Tax=Cloeon dipterum TaxID=197152 RepID=UPI0032200DF1